MRRDVYSMLVWCSVEVIYSGEEEKTLCIVTGGPIVKVKTKADGPRVVSLAQGGGFN